MKIQRTSSPKRGFTLIELMVAMAITTIIVTVLVYITSLATDVWNRSRSELRASRQAKAMIDMMARDFETMVTRRGNTYEWLSAISNPTAPGEKVQSSNSANLVFFSGALDRYNGDIGKSGKDLGGDVSCVGYELFYKDPIDKSGNTYKTFVVNRLLVDPKDTFDDLLGKTDLEAAFESKSSDLDDQNNFVCENVFQFTITFMVECTSASSSSSSQILTVPISISSKSSGTGVTESFKFSGQGIETTAKAPLSVTTDELKAGRISAVEVSVTIISDTAIEQLRVRNFTGDQKEALIAKNSFNYSKRVQVPGM